MLGIRCASRAGRGRPGPRSAPRPRRARAHVPLVHSARTARPPVPQVEGSDLAATVPISYQLLCSGAGRGEDDAHAVVPSEEAAGESGRRQALVDADPVATLRLSAFAKQQVEAAAGVHGAALAAALSAMDASLAGQLRAMLDSAA